MTINKIKQNGAVSLFIVVFTAMLITVVTIGFVNIMVQDQQQATANDLSQSAYDSAQAGIEDAKRALVRLQSVCATGNVADCDKAILDINSADCNVAVKTLSDVTDNGGEIKVQSGVNGLDQSYTCVKVALDTSEYLGVITSDTSKIIPLKVKSVDKFDKVRIEWFSSSDINAVNNFDVSLQSDGKTPLLAQNSSWPTNRPPILQAQLFQFGDLGFKLSDFDSNINSGTLFLYPSTVGLSSLGFDTHDSHKTGAGKPQAIKCLSNLSAGGYSCQATITLPNPLNGGNRIAYLRLSAFYNNTSFKVSLLNSDTLVNFSAVQPSIDSTGRANDLFRRVNARVELKDVNFVYPEAAVDINGNLCKNFLVTDNMGDYNNTCAP